MPSFVLNDSRKLRWAHTDKVGLKQVQTSQNAYSQKVGLKTTLSIKLDHACQDWIQNEQSEKTWSRRSCLDCNGPTQASFATYAYDIRIENDQREQTSCKHTTFGSKMIHAPLRGRQTKSGSNKSTHSKRCPTYLGK